MLFSLVYADWGSHAIENDGWHTHKHTFIRSALCDTHTILVRVLQIVSDGMERTAQCTYRSEEVEREKEVAMAKIFICRPHCFHSNRSHRILHIIRLYYT